MPIKEYKRNALLALKGNWIISVIACFVAILLGGVEGFSVSITYNINVPLIPNVENGVEQASKFLGGDADALLSQLLTYMAISLVASIILFIIGSAVMVGYTRFHLDMANGHKPKLRTLFSHFGQMGTAIWARILVFLHVFVGLMFFIVPGIIAAYKYALVMQVIADNHGITAREALRESKRLMKGNKWKFFCLNFSFIGWAILASIPAGLGYYVLIPYMQASFAEFYLNAKRRAAFFR